MVFFADLHNSKKQNLVSLHTSSYSKLSSAASIPSSTSSFVVFFYHIHTTMISSHSSITALIFSVMMVTLASFAASSEPHLRVQVVEEGGEVPQPEDVGFHPKMEFGFEKGVSCKGGNDVKKGGVGKKCEGKLKKSVSIGVNADETASIMASAMGDMYHDLMPSKDGFLPLDDDMMALIDMDTMDMEGMETGGSKTVKIGGFFKLDWDCTVTYKKDGPLKFSKTVDCGAKALQGSGPPHDTKFDVEDM
jgi:hypothetical protein